jgi:hypothetical protein
MLYTNQKTKVKKYLVHLGLILDFGGRTWCIIWCDIYFGVA